MRTVHSLIRLVSILFTLAQEALRFLLRGTRSRAALNAENIFLRKQLALYLEREVKPRRSTDAIRLTMVLLSRLFVWRDALVVVKPVTFLGCHRKGFRLLWRWKSRPRGRPRLPEMLQELIFSGPGKRVPSQRWMTFVRNHAQAILACDFFIVVTASFRVLYVFVLMEIGTRRIGHFNVTAHPTASWTLQQFREVLTGDASQRFLIHDRDSIYSSELDTALKAMDLRILKTPFQAPQANAFCERLIGTVRRECLDFLIPLNERHLRVLLKEWVTHYNRGRPHSSLGPGIPHPRSGHRRVKPCGHDLPADRQVEAKPILGGLHHEYRLERRAA